MTVARQIIPGSIYLITRRCSERRFFLAPGPEVNQLFGYLLAVQIEAHGLELLGAIQMSNHYHVVVHDVHGNLPNFMRDFHALTARAINRSRNRVDAFWDARQPAVAELADPESVMRMLAYLACNPVRAGLVREGREWPGLRTSTIAAAQPPQVLRRPPGFFKEGSALPEVATLRVVVPPTHRSYTTTRFASELDERVRRAELEIASVFAAEGRQFGHPQDLNRIKWNQAPDSADGRGELSPRVIATDATRRRGLLSRIRCFAAAYCRARRQYARGIRDTIFPGGTWGLVYFLRLDVEPAPRPAWQL